MKKYIFDCTKALKLSKTKKTNLKFVSLDLEQIKKRVPEIEKIVVRGGFVADLILGCSPCDIDLFYQIKDKKTGEYSKKCHCSEIKKAIRKINFKIFDWNEIDLENSFEKPPLFDLIERTLGVFSYHTDFLSMFCIDEHGKIWSNKDSFYCLKNKILELNYAGFVPWSYFRKKHENFDFYSFPLYVITRGLAHISRRDLKPGKNFRLLLKQTPFLLANAKRGRDYKHVQNYMQKKLANVDYQKVIKQVLGRGSSRVIKSFQEILVEK
ncbi:MAG: hypothetical protein ABIB61_02430 [Candidatus Shapirobacteria bacterium]